MGTWIYYWNHLWTSMTIEFLWQMSRVQSPNCELEHIRGMSCHDLFWTPWGIS